MAVNDYFWITYSSYGQTTQYLYIKGFFPQGWSIIDVLQPAQLHPFFMFESLIEVMLVI